MAAPRSRFDWNDLPILLALARSGSMRTAGRQLGIDTSTVSRRLAAAEARLQTRLFIRRPDGYAPTDAGRAFLASAESIEAGMQSLVSSTREATDSVGGTVRLTSVDVVLDAWLIPRLGPLLDAHPQLQLRLVSDNQVLSFTRGEADLALRVARPREDAAVLMRRVATSGIAVFGAPMFKRVPREGWRELPWLAFDDDLADSVEMKWLRKFAPATGPRFRCSSMSAMISACEAGLGLALLPCFAVRSMSLQRLSSGIEFKRDLYLLSHRDARKIKRFRTVADWIAARAQADAAFLSGEG